MLKFKRKFRFLKVNGISNFAAGHGTFYCVRPNKETPNQKTTFRIVKILGKQGVSTTGNALVLWKFEHTIRYSLTRSQSKYLRILSWENDQFKTGCHQADRQLYAQPLDSTQYISYKPVLQLQEFITAIGFVVFWVKGLQAGLFYFYGKALLHVSGYIIIKIIIYLSWSWATCWPFPVSRIEKSLQRSAMIPSASCRIMFLYPG